LTYQILQSKSTPEDKSVSTIDPAVYVLGTGDVIEIRSSKTPWNVYSGTVSEDGSLFIPGLGKFDADNKVFQNVRKEISGFLMNQNPKEDIDVILSAAKQVEIVVTGDAVSSGSYRLSGSLRILDAIKLALRDSMSLFKDINYRNVSVTVHGKKTCYDLSGYISSGVGLENPYLYPGAIISVSPVTKWFTVSGAVSSAFPESIPARENDTYGQIFRLFKLTEYADTTNVLIYRSGMQVTRYCLSQLYRMSSEKVKDLDYIIIGSVKPPSEQIQVTIKGEIKNPGIYPFEKGTHLKVSQVATVAGGFTENADSGRVYIIRKDPLGKLSNRISRELGDIQRKDQFGQSVIISGDYRIVSLKKASAVLENNDVIIVPEVSNTVYISGNVRKPGAYQYVEGASKKYYIKLAGGTTVKANRRNSCIVTAYSDYWVVKATPDVDAGDLIVVPIRPQNERMQRYDVLIRTLYYIAMTVTAGIAAGKALNLIEED
jgi:protein involved in polysaccharide export with SLBB domain